MLACYSAIVIMEQLALMLACYSAKVSAALYSLLRTDNAIKNHWNSTLKKKMEKEGYLQFLQLHSLAMSSSSATRPAPRTANMPSKVSTQPRNVIHPPQSR